MKKWIRDERGYAIVEATVVFPVMILFITAMILLSIYLPTRAQLQRATQYAATALATEQSDTWIYFDPKKMQYALKSKDGLGANKLSNVYVDFFQSLIPPNGEEKARVMVNRGVDATVECSMKNFVVYKELTVTATKTLPVGSSHWLLPLPDMTITVSSTAVIQNGDEFLRTVDLATDFAKYLINKNMELSKAMGKIDEMKAKIGNFLGWK